MNEKLNKSIGNFISPEKIEKIIRTGINYTELETGLLKERVKSNIDAYNDFNTQIDPFFYKKKNKIDPRAGINITEVPPHIHYDGKYEYTQVSKYEPISKQDHEFNSFMEDIKYMKKKDSY